MTHADVKQFIMLEHIKTFSYGSQTVVDCSLPDFDNTLATSFFRTVYKI